MKKRLKYPIQFKEKCPHSSKYKTNITTYKPFVPPRLLHQCLCLSLQEILFNYSIGFMFLSSVSFTLLADLIIPANSWLRSLSTNLSNPGSTVVYVCIMMRETFVRREFPLNSPSFMNIIYFVLPRFVLSFVFRLFSIYVRYSISTTTSNFSISEYYSH